MNYTVLDIVQKILSSMDGDNVNSIDDTLESEQVTDIVEDVFYEIIDEFNIPGRYTLLQLTASGTTDRPTHMILPTSTRFVKWIKYDVRESAGADPDFKLIGYIPPEEFHNRVMLRNSSDTEVDAITDTSGVTLFIYNDRAPSYYTSFDDETVVFDAYDSTVDSTLQSSKTQAYGYKVPTFTRSDTYKPEIPDHFKQLLLRESMAMSHALLKEINPKVEKRARKSRVRLRSNRNRIPGEHYDPPVDFGKHR